MNKTAKGYDEPEGAQEVLLQLLAELSELTQYEIKAELLPGVTPYIEKGKESSATARVLSWYLEECSSGTLMDIALACIDFLADREEKEKLEEIQELVDCRLEDADPPLEPSPEELLQARIEYENTLPIMDERNRRAEELMHQLEPLMPTINRICNQHKGEMIKPFTLDMIRSKLVAFLESQRIEGKLTQLPEIETDWDGLTNEVVCYFKLP